MNLIDAHAHVFQSVHSFGANGELRARGHGKARWATGEEIDVIPSGYGDQSFTAESYIRLMDENSIEKAVLVQGGLSGYDNSYLKSVAEQYPGRFVSACTFDPFCRNITKILENLLPSFRVVYLDMSTYTGCMSNHYDFRLDSDLMLLIYESLAKLGVIVGFDLGCYGDKSNQPDAIANIARTFPGLRIVISHLLGPRLTTPPYMFEWNLMMTKSDNVYYDFSALPLTLGPEAFPFPSAQKCLRQAIKLVGADKLLWGSDAPFAVCRHSMDELVSYASRVLLADEAKLIFHDNAERLYFT